MRFKVLLGLLGAFALYLLVMDYILYRRMQDYAIRPSAGNSEPRYASQVPCDVDPFCAVTVKALMLDYPNLYILSPLAAVVDRSLGISTSWTWLTPNMISGCHVLLAVLAAQCVSSASLSDRRLGVLLFELRTWLDDMDGHVARRRKHVSGERSDVGSTGYLVDGACDALGCVALMIGLFLFLKRNPPTRRGYERLSRKLRHPRGLESQDLGDASELACKRLRFRALLRNVLLVGGHLAIASISWNRYIALYQDLLESDEPAVAITRDELYARQSQVMRSGFFWLVAGTWRLVNFHTALDYLLVAIFIDRLWEYTRFISWLGYVVPLAVVYLTEFHFLESYAFVLKGPSAAGFAAKTESAPPYVNSSHVVAAF